jgi:hemoglobin
VSIFDDIGGTPAVRTAVAVLYDRIAGDPLLAEWFAGTDMKKLRRHQLLFLTAALGGPDEYGGRSLTKAHRGLGITSEAFDALIGHLDHALGGIGVASELREEIIARIGSRRSEVVEGAST